MSLQYEQALALFGEMLGSPKVKAHLNGSIGWGKVPKAEDFDSQDPDARDRCEEMAEHISECVKVVLAVLKTRPKQSRIDLGKEDAPEGGKKRRRGKDAAAGEEAVA